MGSKQGYVNREAWYSHYEDLCDYIVKNDALPKNGSPLYSWLRWMLRRYKAKELPKDLVEVLEAFAWWDKSGEVHESYRKYKQRIALSAMTKVQSCIENSSDEDEDSLLRNLNGLTDDEVYRLNQLGICGTKTLLLYVSVNNEALLQGDLQIFELVNKALCAVCDEIIDVPTIALKFYKNTENLHSWVEVFTKYLNFSAKVHKANVHAYDCHLTAQMISTIDEVYVKGKSVQLVAKERGCTRANVDDRRHKALRRIKEVSKGESKHF